MTQLLPNNWRKKFTLAMLLFAMGSAHAFMFVWEPSYVIAFATLLLGSFGAADLVDKKVSNKE